MPSPHWLTMERNPTPSKGKSTVTANQRKTRMTAGHRTAPGGRDVQKGMGHVGAAGDDNHAVECVEIPRHAADQRFGPEREESHRADGNDIAECENDRREKDRHEQPRLEKFFPG